MQTHAGQKNMQALTELDGGCLASHLWDKKCPFRSLQISMTKVTPKMWVDSTTPQNKKENLHPQFSISDALLG
jgi:hypothetical protein